MVNRMTRSYAKAEARLKPCPFCGAADIRIYPQCYGYIVRCQTCPALMRVVTGYLKQAEASWNGRAK